MPGSTNSAPATTPPFTPCSSQPRYVASCCASGPGSRVQKLSACRKRASETQRRSSTTSRCSSAIWPAGPPKESRPIFSQTRTASAKEGIAAGVVAACGVPAATGSAGAGDAASGRGRSSATLPPEVPVEVLEHGRAAREPLPVAAGADADAGHQRPDAVRLGAGELRVLEVDVVDGLRP